MLFYDLINIKTIFLKLLIDADGHWPKMKKILACYAPLGLTVASKLLHLNNKECTYKNDVSNLHNRLSSQTFYSNSRAVFNYDNLLLTSSQPLNYFL